MLVSITLGILLLMTLLSLILGSNFAEFASEIGIDNEALVDGVPSTYEVVSQDILFYIDANQIGGAIFILTITMIIIAVALGITVLGSGIATSSIKIIVFATMLGGVWALLTVLAYPLIISIELFGVSIYIMLTIGFVIGSFQLISGSET